MKTRNHSLKASLRSFSVRSILLVTLCAGGLFAPSAEPAAMAQGSPGRPNIVVVMTDDQDAASAALMPKLQRLVAAEGVTFDNSIVSYSFCCPSRATFYTGQYAHNHGVLTNEPPHGGYPRLKPTIGNTLPVWLQRSGYRTGLVGEFLNGYAEAAVPPGWSEWHAAIASGYYGYILNENGKIVRYGDPRVADPQFYGTDVFAHKATDFIRRHAPSDAPFFLQVGAAAPHSEAPSVCNCGDNNPRAAPRHEGAFKDLPLPKPPSYSEADVSDKPELVRVMTPIPPLAEQQVTASYRSRLESLLAVDDMVGDIVQTLTEAGEIDNTVIVFTSDNGWLQGEHRWRAGKVLPYEPSIRVPLIIRGPGFPKTLGRSSRLVSNVDLAPTLLDYANAPAGRPQDGQSLLDLAGQPSAITSGFGRAIKLEAYFNAFGEYGDLGPRIVYKGVRTQRYKYVKYENGEEELYDLAVDPFELESRHRDPAYASIKEGLAPLATKLRACVGEGCGAARGFTTPDPTEPKSNPFRLTYRAKSPQRLRQGGRRNNLTSTVGCSQPCSTRITRYARGLRRGRWHRLRGLNRRRGPFNFERSARLSFSFNQAEHRRLSSAFRRYRRVQFVMRADGSDMLRRRSSATKRISLLPPRGLKRTKRQTRRASPR